MRRDLRACLKYNLKRLMSMPVFWAVLVLTALFLDRDIAPVRMYLQDSGDRISWPGLLAFLLDSSSVTLLGGLSVLALLFNLPMTDEAQTYIMLRSGRKTWARAQVMLVFVVTALYMAVLALGTLLWIAPHVDWTGGWSPGILAFVEDGAFEVYDSMLNYDPWIVRQYEPIGAALLGLALHFLAYSVLAMLMYVGNLFDRRAGLLLGAAPLALDALMMEVYSGGIYYVSPVTLSRITALNYGDGMGSPPVWYAFVALLALLAGLSWLAVWRSEKKELHA